MDKVQKHNSFNKKKIPSPPLPGIELGRPDRSLVTLLTELLRLRNCPICTI
jgi:hypothetical protein